MKTLRKNLLQLVSLLTVTCLPQVVSAAGVVTTNTESALVAAMAHGGTVTFAVDGIIYLTNTIVISNNTTLDATGYNVGISGSNAVEIFVVNAGTTVAMTNLTLRDGFTTGPSSSLAYNNSAYGGAISNAGSLQLTGCVFSNDSAVSGSDAYVGDGDGGAVYNTGGVMASDCVFVGNSAIGLSQPQSGNIFYIADGGSGNGGACYNANEATFINCVFSNNIAVGGFGGSYAGLNPFNGYPGGPGIGGAVCNSGTLVASNNTFALNVATGGQGGIGGYEVGGPYQTPGGNGGGGANGNGGGICTLGGSVILVNDTFWSNGAIGGVGGTGGNGEEPAGRETGGAGGNGGQGGAGIGGAICDLGGVLFMTNLTVASNTVAAGPGGAAGQGGYTGYPSEPGPNGVNGPAGSASGCALASVGATGTLKNSILSADISTDTNIFGPLIDAGNNISFDDQDSLTNSTSYNGINPLLAPLGNYGGLTATMALLPGSPAIDHADVHAFPPTDQRGHPRPYGPAPDIGAFEYAPANTLISGAYSSGQLHLAYQGTNGQTYCIQTSVNFSQWYPIATNTIGVSGYQDMAYAVTNFPHQYFRAVSP